MSDEIPYPPDALPPEEYPEQPNAEAEHFDDVEMPAETDDDFRIRSTQEFEAVLEALADYPGDLPESEVESAEDVDEVAAETFATLAEEHETAEAEPDEEAIFPADTEAEEAEEALAAAASPPPPTVNGEERVRPPRARRFRRALRNQIGMLPLALGMLALGAYLIARAREVQGLPALSNAELAGLSVLVLGFSAFFHALLFGRRERGLIFVGVWIWVTAGAVVALAYELDASADATVWWPILLWSTALTFVLTYLVERTHDARLLLLSMIALVAGTTAYMVTSGRVSADVLDEAASYWPLLLTVIGVGVLPVAFRQRTE